MGRLVTSLGVERWGRDRQWLALLFHHLTDGDRWRRDDPYISGLDLDVPVELFADRIVAISRRYDIVGLEEALAAPTRSGRGRKPVLLCFDDAYRSVVELAAPFLAERSLPWCFFVNPGLVGNTTLAVDNFLAYVMNTAGPEPLTKVLGRPVGSLKEVLGSVLPGFTPFERRELMDSVSAELGLDVTRLCKEARLYVEAHEIRALSDAGVEIGNHTADHVHCRALDADTVEEQVVDSARAISGMTGRPVRAFAYPYGSRADATPLVTTTLRRSGHTCAFLVHARPNTLRTDRYHLHRINLVGHDDAANALELEVLPRLRSVRALAKGHRG